MDQSPATPQVTQLLKQARSGDEQAKGRVVDLIHGELRQIAGRQMNQEGAVTLQATGLVNEAYIELFGKTGSGWTDRNHFFAYAATVMRHILVREARRRLALKRGGGQVRVTLDGLSDAQRDDELVALDQALTRLAELDERKSRVIELRYFGGLTIDEICEVTGLSAATVHKDMKAARGWLFRQLNR